MTRVRCLPALAPGGWIIALAVLASLAGCGPSGPAPGSPPVAVFPAASHDFGAVVEGRRLEHTFAVRNEGGSALAIDVVEGPDFVAIERLDAPIAPGGEGAIVVSVPSERLPRSTRLGVRISTNDPELPEEILYLEGRRVAPIEIRPRDRVYLFDVVRGEPASEVLEIVNHTGEPVRITGVDGGSGVFTHRLETIEAGRHYRLTAGLDPGAPAGKHEDTLALRTDDEDRPVLEVRLLATVRERVHAQPGEIDFARFLYENLDDAFLTDKTLRVDRHRGGGFELVEVASDLGFLELEVETETPGESYLVHVRIDPERARRGEFAGRVRIRTNDPDRPVIEVPVRGTIV